MKLKSAAGMLAALLATTAATPTFAQSQDETAEIVVTGEKANRSIQDTPTSVRVFSKEDIERENLTNVFDLFRRTANVSTTFDDQGFTIRGIANDNVTGVGTGDLATVYLDGSPLPRAALQGPLDLWDLEAVEILRGPQSTLQGRNALAGAVILRTTAPSFDWTGRARAILTDTGGERRFAAALGGPIVADQIAFRIAGEHLRKKGYVTNETLDDERAGFRDGDNIRAKLLVTPTALPGLKLVVGYLHDVHSNGVAYSFDDYPGAFDHRITLGNRPTRDRTRSDIGTLDASYALSPALSINAVSTYSRIRTLTVYDGDDLPEDSAYGDLTQDQRTFTQEVRLNLDTDRFDALLGGYYSHLDNGEERAHSVFKLRPVQDLGLPAAIGGFYPAELVIDTNQFYPQTVRNLAIFGDATWEVVPHLKLRAGFRYDHERQVRANNNSVTLATPLPDPAAFGSLGPTISTINGLINAQLSAANSSSPPAKTSFHAFLPKGGLTWEISNAASIAATVQRGYRSGGSGVNPGRGRLYTYKPEFTWNYELALRSLWLDRKLSANANLFYIAWKDQQVNAQLSSNRYDYETINAGSSRVWGGELELRYRPDRTWDLYASAGYSNTRFDQLDISDRGGGNLSGEEFPFAPRWTLAGGVSWQHPRGWTVDANVSYRSAAFESVLDQTRRELPGYAFVNGKIGWQNDRYGAFLTARNLFNARNLGYTYLNVRQETQFGEPRVIGVLLQGRF